MQRLQTLSSPVLVGQLEDALLPFVALPSRFEENSKQADPGQQYSGHSFFSHFSYSRLISENPYDARKSLPNAPPGLHFQHEISEWKPAIETTTPTPRP